MLRQRELQESQMLKQGVEELAEHSTPAKSSGGGGGRGGGGGGSASDKARERWAMVRMSVRLGGLVTDSLEGMQVRFRLSAPCAPPMRPAVRAPNRGLSL